MANLSHVSNGNFQHNIFEHDALNKSSVNVGHATDVRIEQNTFNAPYQQYYSQRVVISSNTFVNQRRGAAFAAAMILSDSGSANRVVGNTIDGKWVGFGQTEIDDGIVVGDESGDVVSENTISNVFECGIETSGVIADTTISNNDITRTGFCGIGGWYWNSLRASTISGNVVTAVPTLFYFYRVLGLRPAGYDSLHEMPADTAVFFSDNLFDGNRLVDPSAGALYSSILHLYNNLDFNGVTSSAIPGERVPGPSDFVLTNNVFRNNDFGHALPAPAFGSPIVPGRVVDGGGNVCNNAGGAPYPLACR
jgi:parallel beta-helix repeat protein